MFMSGVKNSLLRIRAIDSALRSSSKPYPSLKELIEACSVALYGEGDNTVSTSSVEKDLKKMRKNHGAPIKYCRVNRGYYYTDKHYSISDAPLSGADEEALRSATNILRQFKGNPLLKEYESAIDKIINRINISDKIQDNAVDKYVQFETQETVKGSEFLDKILKAIKENQIIQFNYNKFQDKDSKIRRLAPYLLKEYRNRWYVIGKSELKGDIRTFALDRVNDLEVLSQNFVRDVGFSADNYFMNVIGITTGKDFPKIIQIETNEVLSKYLLSQPLHHSQTYLGTSENGGHLFEYYLLLTYELVAQLLSYGSQVKVLFPVELVEQIKNENKRVKALYE